MLLSINYNKRERINQMTNEELAIQIKSGQTSLYAELWEQVNKFIMQYANRFYASSNVACINAGVDIDDLIQSGYIALCDAVNAYNESTGYNLLSYITYPLKNRFNELLKRKTSKRDPLTNCLSLNKEMGEDDNNYTLADTIVDETATDKFDDILNQDFQERLHDTLDECLQTLEDTYRVVLVRRCYNNETMASIAKDMNTNISQIRKIEYKAIQKMRCGENLKKLEPFREDSVSCHAYIGTGFTAWKNSGISCVERVTEKLNKLKA